MTRDEVIAMAQEAGFDLHYAGGEGIPPSAAVFGRCTDEMLNRFAALVAAKEREACAKVCEVKSDRWAAVDDEISSVLQSCAGSIRARGQEAA